MKAFLRSSVRLFELIAFAELAVWEQRPELTALCAAGPQLDEAVVDDVLPGLSARGRENLLRAMVEQGLLRPDGQTTRYGARCASTGEAPIWEQGVYAFLGASHPVFGVTLLDFRRLSSDFRDRNFDAAVPFPTDVRPDPDAVFSSVLNPSLRFAVAAFPAPRGAAPVCRGRDLPDAELTWEIDPLSGANAWRVCGVMQTEEGQRSFTTDAVELDPTRLAQIYSHWDAAWDDASERAASSFDGGVDDDGHDSFLRTRRLATVGIPRCGTFSDVVVEDVPVGPATDRDARAWALSMVALQVRAADQYLDEETLEGTWAATGNGTPLAPRSGACPSSTELTTANGLAIEPRVRWLLAAAADLGAV